MKAQLLTLVSVVASVTACQAADDYTPRNGDIVFQVSRSNQSRAIQLVTGSPYSHMGIVYLRDGEPVVFEAVSICSMPDGRTTLFPTCSWVMSTTGASSPSAR